MGWKLHFGNTRMMNAFLPKYNTDFIASCCLQVRDLISVQPIELKIPMADPNKFLRSSSLLHLNNYTVGHVAYRILSNSLSPHLVWPSFGFVPPGCRYTIAVTMRYQQNPPPSKDMFFTLESTRASDHEIKNAISRNLMYEHNDFFTKAKDKGRQVHKAKLTAVYGNSDQVSFLLSLITPISFCICYSLSLHKA